MARLNVLVVYNVPLTEHARDNIFLNTTRIYMFNMYNLRRRDLPPTTTTSSIFYSIADVEDRTTHLSHQLWRAFDSYLARTKSISVDRIERCPHVSGQVYVAGEEILGPEIIWQAARKRHVK